MQDIGYAALCYASPSQDVCIHDTCAGPTCTCTRGQPPSNKLELEPINLAHMFLENQLDFIKIVYV